MLANRRQSLEAYTAPADSRDWLSAGSLAVLGTGSALPGRPVTTDALLGDLAPWLTSRDHNRAEAVADKLGVMTRHVARPWRTRLEPPAAGCSNAELAARALRGALHDAGLQAGDLGYLISHTATPVQALPGNVAFVADQLGYSGPHIELRQACTGFANALMIAFGLLMQPGARPVAIVGSETGSAFLDPDALAFDPGQLVNLVQMGDGAGAIILGPACSGRDTLHSAWFGCRGLGRPPGIEQRESSKLRADAKAGPVQFSHDFRAILEAGPGLFEAGVGAAAAHGFPVAAADTIVPHQVSGRIADQLAEHLALPPECVFVNANRLGNTGSAAIWIAIDELRGTSIWPGHTALVLGAEATKFMHGGFVLATG